MTVANDFPSTKTQDVIDKVNQDMTTNATEIERITNNVSAVADSITAKLAAIANQQETILERQRDIRAEIDKLIGGMDNDG